jgi:hypothetical protein
LPRWYCGENDAPFGQAGNWRSIADLEQAIDCALTASAQFRKLFLSQEFIDLGIGDSGGIGGRAQQRRLSGVCDVSGHA